MNVEILQNGNAVTALIEGRLDTVTSPELENMLAPYFETQGIDFILDFNKLEYISSAGLRVVLMAYKKFTAQGGHMVIKNVCKEVRSVFDMTGFSRILTIE